MTTPSKSSEPSSFEDVAPRISVFGVGGAGGNAVNNMIRSNLKGVEFYVCNTDAQALKQSMAPYKIQLGPTITKGLGAGSKPDVGRASAEEIIGDLDTYFEGLNMVFITAGMGGGTGTGAAPIIAQAARDKGILTVGVVTKPFHFEGVHRMHSADKGIEEMQKCVDTLIVIPNQNLFRIANERTTFAEAFKMADEVLHAGVRGITDLMIMPGLINLDFADVRTVMSEMGKAMMGTGEAEGDNRAIEAAEAAISNPLLDDVSMRGSRGVLISITGGDDLTLYEVDEAANRIREEVDADANIIFGSTFNQEVNGKIRVSVVATGIDAQDVPVTSTPTSQIPKNYLVEEQLTTEISLTETTLMNEDQQDNLDAIFGDAVIDDGSTSDAEVNTTFDSASSDGYTESQNTDDLAPPAKPTFFQRLGFGRRKDDALRKKNTPQQKPLPKVPTLEETVVVEEDDTYDIPAYLRKRP